MRKYHIVTIAGDGIGPEILESALAVLARVQELSGEFALEYEEREGGAACYERHGVNLSKESLEACRTADSVLKAPVGLPWVRYPDGTEAGLLGGVLRNGLDLYANVRPVKLWPGVDAPIKAKAGEIDYVIIRENTEGLYLSRGLGVGNDEAMADMLLMTRKGVERVCRFAFEAARKRSGSPSDGVRRVTCVDKSNVLRSFAFFRRIFQEVGEQYPDIEQDFLYSDAAGQDLVRRPWRFDVLVMENFLGDLLSDLGGGTVGGLGMCPSGNIGEGASYFEPIHGTAPDIAGKGVANPLSQVLAAAMMLDHLGETAAGTMIRDAVWEALVQEDLVIQASGQPRGGSRTATEAILRHLRHGVGPQREH
ncbi:MAG: isocitrate/isopropylmalate dehydrogenase family protein [Chloroflexi bacterium]|nr:isocitrate/isopropylmalate dehydrogenase family protein [Chloroflexota bacterium]